MTKTYLDPQEVRLLENAATNPRNRLLVRVLFRLGCRVSEALALSPDDIDLEQGWVTIIHLKRRLRVFCPHCNTRLGRSHGFCPGCGSKIEASVRKELDERRIRNLPLDVETAEMLRDYIQKGGPVERNSKILIFGINRHRAWQIVSDLAKKAALPRLVHPESGKEHGVSPHRLRDAFAVMAVKFDDSGDGLRLLQEQLGHESFNTTARYRKASGKEHKRWHQRLWSNYTKHPAKIAKKELSSGH